MPAFLRGLQPTACILGSKGNPRPHWRAEKCFSRCACPREKRISIYFPALGGKTLPRAFLPGNFHISLGSYHCLSLPELRFGEVFFCLGIRGTIFLNFFATFSKLPSLMGEGGDGVADFERIYTDHFPSVYKYIFSLCRNPAIVAPEAQLLRGHFCQHPEGYLWHFLADS